jgi:protein MPE1
VLICAQHEQGGQELYMDPQLANDLAMRKMVAESIPQLQAQIKQLAQVVQNSALPVAVRQQAEAQLQQLQLQHAQAQELEAAFAMQEQMPMPDTGTMMAAWLSGGQGFDGAGPGPGASQAGPAQDSAYQRLPVNNRRRNLKRDRPSDFLEIAGPEAIDAGKVARYWE